jgi:hypothetical protein
MVSGMPTKATIIKITKLLMSPGLYVLKIGLLVMVVAPASRRV